AKQTEVELPLRIFIPLYTKPGLYLGGIKIIADEFDKRIPVSIRVLKTTESLLDLKIQPLTDMISPDETLKSEVSIYNLGKTKRVDIQLNLQLIDGKTEEIILETEESIAIETTVSLIKNIKIPKDLPLGKYVVKAIASYTADKNQTMQASSIAYVTVVEPWYDRKLFGIEGKWYFTLIFICIVLAVVVFAYKRSVAKKKRFHQKVELSTLPQPEKNACYIGKLAEQNMRTFLPMNNMQMHTIVAGSTGGGKSIASQVIIEEVLLHGKSVIVFDPTAQWTGFLRKCKEKFMLKNYSNFQMKRADAKAFSGNVHTIKNARELIDIKKYMKGNEINIFDISKMDPKDMDVFVVNTIRQIFKANLEESHDLKLLIVFDEVHRLLSKFGGSGQGFIQIERGCREFRKWGVGLMLISQVLSDFVGEIKANIGTEIQMRTRNEDDMERIKIKYGESMVQSIIKAPVGTGMLQNAAFNRGRPYFISFRPIYHSVKRLSDEELELYDKYNIKLDDIRYQIEQLSEFKIDVFDLELELKLASTKLGKGAFNMVDIYLESIESRMISQWEKIGKTPKKKEILLADEEELKNEVKKAEKERKEYEDKAKQEKVENLKQNYDELQKSIVLMRKEKGKDAPVSDEQIEKIQKEIDAALKTEDEKDVDKAKNSLDQLKKNIEK
ncbi:MAG: DUF87 domain-containing protein, partial [Candidatus Aenigmarchaeota archaeon]|nr:DUF87 domain-containing protein [Candidatus Aenigmarchaeota archaeon]